jgi:uncharacterized protein (DUF486 family)
VWPPEVSAGALFKVMLGSWSIAFAEHCFQEPANRIGSYESPLCNSRRFRSSVWYLGDELKWNYFVGFGFMVMAVWVLSRSGQAVSKGPFAGR